MSKFTVYQAVSGFEAALEKELGSWDFVVGRLYGKVGHEPVKAFWVETIWFDAERVEISSIGDGARKLKAHRGVRWSLFSLQHHRRGQLIQEQVPQAKSKGGGAWALLEPGIMLVSPRTSSPFPLGQIAFEEDKVGPPSRAYLKLWEAFANLGEAPVPGDLCVDLGACPGGWTWVLVQRGAKVISVDRSPLREDLMRNPLVEFQKGNAFGFVPGEQEIDWLCSDVICYPQKLLEFVKLWVDSGKCKRMVITIKFQGSDSYGVASEFAEIPGGQVVHLCANKHELTFLWKNKE